MGRKDPRVDHYIANAQPFARPILKHLRALVHAGCPEVEETIKWGMPSFTYRGILCGMAAFKEHCAFGFWKSSLVGAAGRKRGDAPEARAMGQFGRITSLDDLPGDAAITRMVKKARALNEEGVTRPARRRAPAGERTLEVPADLAAALRKNRAARTHFDAFSYSHRKEYVDWITGAKTEATRQRRLATAIEWLSEGKSQNWRYEKKKTTTS